MLVWSAGGRSSEVRGCACSAVLVVVIAVSDWRNLTIAMSLTKYRKLAVLGHSAVGKTALTYQFVKGKIPHRYRPTIESTYRTTLIHGMDEYDLVLLDTANHMECTRLPPAYLTDIDGYIIMYSLDSRKSFHIASVLFQKLEERRGKASSPIVLVGNKRDLPVESRKVLTIEGQSLAETWQTPFMEITAKDYEECKRVFLKVLEEVDRVQSALAQKKTCQLL